MKKLIVAILAILLPGGAVAQTVQQYTTVASIAALKAITNRPQVVEVVDANPGIFNLSQGACSAADDVFQVQPTTGSTVCYTRMGTPYALGKSATANGVAITNGSGVPLISTTLPAVNGAALTNLNLAVGNSTVANGTSLGVLFNDGGSVGNTNSATNGVLLTNGSGIPSIVRSGARNWRAYGAKGDAQWLNGVNATIASGTPNLTVAGASFTAADVGKKVHVPGAGTAGAPLVATINARVSGTQLTLGSNASTSCSPCNTTVTWGTDDTAAIQAATTAAGNGISYGPAGAYFVTAAIAVAGSTNTVVAGDGSGQLSVATPWYGTLLLQACTTCDGLTFSNPNTVLIAGGGVRDLYIRGAGPINGVNVQGVGLRTAGQGNTWFANNFNVESFAIGVTADQNWNGNWSNGQISFYQYQGLSVGCDAGYQATGGNTFTNLKITNFVGVSPAVNTAYGLMTCQSGGNLYSTIDITANQVGVMLQPLSGRTLAYDTFYNVIGDSSSATNWVFDSSNGNINSIACTSCWAGYSFGAGITMFGPNINGVMFTALRIRESVEAGLVVYNANNLTINGGSIESNGRNAAPGTYPGILIDSNVSNFKISNVRFGNFASAFNKQGSSIVVNSGTSTNYEIANNISVNIAGGAQPIVDGGSGTKLVFGNLPTTPSVVPNKTTFTGVMAATGLPTSCSGQTTGTLWNDSGTVKVCP